MKEWESKMREIMDGWVCGWVYGGGTEREGEKESDKRVEEEKETGPGCFLSGPVGHAVQYAAARRAVVFSPRGLASALRGLHRGYF